MDQQQPKLGTLEYFRNQCAEFFEQMGYKSFWTGNKPHLAKKAIASQYLALNVAPDQKEPAATLFQTVMAEYTHRALLLDYDL